MSFTVTAAEQGSFTSNGMTVFLRVITGASGTQPGAVAGVTSTTPSDSITPQASGSWVYGAILGLHGTYTTVSGTTTKQNANDGGLNYLSCRTVGTTTASTPVTVGYTATANGISVSLCEILASGTLAEDASSPAGSGLVSAKTFTTAAFTPPAGSLLVMMVCTNGAGGGSVTVAVSDTSGLGLTWVEQEKQNGTGHGYSGIWTAQVPGGTSHTATAALTVPPSFSAARTRGKYRTGSLTVTPSFSAATAGKARAAALTVTPSLAAARTRGKYRTASLTVTPSLAAAARQSVTAVNAASNPAVTAGTMSTSQVTQAAAAVPTVSGG